MAHIGGVAVATVLSIFGWLTLLLNAVTVALIAMLVRRTRPQFKLFELFVSRVRHVAAVVTVAASLGSLYLSEIGNLTPCRWCWIQRTAMYPLALILVIALCFRDGHVRRYALPMAMLGMSASVWHYLLQRIPSLSDADSCSLLTPCSVTYLDKFGFISIPWMAGSVFLFAVVLLAGFGSEKSGVG